MTFDPVTTASIWHENRSLFVGMHGCYFCWPEIYPPMPEGQTLCVRCGSLIRTWRSEMDPMNENGEVCMACLEDMALERRFDATG
jgi:hypothetical protein